MFESIDQCQLHYRWILHGVIWNKLKLSWFAWERLTEAERNALVDKELKQWEDLAEAKLRKAGITPRNEGDQE